MYIEWMGELLVLGLILIALSLIIKTIVDIFIWNKERKRYFYLSSKFDDIFTKVNYISYIIDDKVLNNIKISLTEILYDKYPKMDMNNLDDRLVWKYLNKSLKIVVEKYYLIKEEKIIDSFEDIMERDIIYNNVETDYFKNFDCSFHEWVGKVKYETLQEFNLQFKVNLGKDPSEDEYKEYLQTYIKHFFNIYCDKVIHLYKIYKRDRCSDETGIKNKKGTLSSEDKIKLREELLNDMAKGKKGVKTSINNLRNNLDYLSPELREELILVEGRFNDFLKKERTGVLEKGEDNYENIKASLVYIIDQI